VRPCSVDVVGLHVGLHVPIACVTVFTGSINSGDRHSLN